MHSAGRVQQCTNFISCYVIPKNKTVPIILINTNVTNVKIQQLLLAARIYEAKHYPWQYNIAMHCEEHNVKLRFWPVPLANTKMELGNVQKSKENLQAEKPEESLLPFRPSQMPTRIWLWNKSEPSTIAVQSQ